MYSLYQAVVKNDGRDSVYKRCQRTPSFFCVPLAVHPPQHQPHLHTFHPKLLPKHNQPNTANMQFSFVAALSMASLAAAQGWNGLCIQKGAAACSGEFPKECSTSSGTGVIFTTCCLSTVTCSQP
ncbi:hypothetical protein PG995_010566 [Apiospora arundinis]